MALTLLSFCELCFVSVFAWAFQTALASGTSKGFLGTREGHSGAVSRRGPVDLLAKLNELHHDEDFNHEQMTAARVDRLEEALLPIFKVSVKDNMGRLDANAARYALHRLFVQRHGWHVSGIELHGAARSTSKIGDALVESGAFSLRQLAHFAATLETLVHVENMQRLQRVFDGIGLSKQASRNNEALAKKVIEAYMALYVTSWLPANTSYTRALKAVEYSYPAWPETKIFVEEIRQTLSEADDAKEARSLWDICLRVVEEVAERYGRWQNRDCVDLKKALLTIEAPGTGRVPLHAFWAPLLSTRNWMFDESLPYLEQLGALEGSEAPHHSVVIPNYIYSSANCLASSAYYDVCCINECENLLGEIEASVQTAAVSPQQLAQTVSGLPSDTVAAPRDLPVELRRRLDDIAAHHGGLVPLHGRLFAQFMHHAYPRECPYPHLSVSVASQKSEAWIRPQTRESTVSSSVVEAYMIQAGNFSGDASLGFPEIPWSEEEDLFTNSLWLDKDMTVQASHPSSVLSKLGLLVGMGTMMIALRRHLAQPLGKGSCHVHVHSV